MARKKITPQHRHYLNVVRNYYTHFNSPAEIADTFGVSRATAKRWIEDIKQGNDPIKSESKAKQYIDKLKEAPKYFQGDEELKLHKSPIEGEKFYIQDYELKIGAKLPKTPANNMAYGYQIIIKGKDPRGKRGVTTSIAGSPEEALDLAHTQMRNYARFVGSQIFLRVFTEMEDIGDIEDIEGYEDFSDEYEWSE